MERAIFIILILALPILLLGWLMLEHFQPTWGGMVITAIVGIGYIGFMTMKTRG